MALRVCSKRGVASFTGRAFVSCRKWPALHSEGGRQQCLLCCVMSAVYFSLPASLPSQHSHPSLPFPSLFSFSLCHIPSLFLSFLFIYLSFHPPLPSSPLLGMLLPLEGSKGGSAVKGVCVCVSSITPENPSWVHRRASHFPPPPTLFLPVTASASLSAVKLPLDFFSQPVRK